MPTTSRLAPRPARQWRATRQLQAIGPPPHLNSKQFATRVRWATNFGGVCTNETYGTLVRGLLASLVRSSDYSPGDVIRTVRGVSTTQAALLPELATMDLARTLPRIDLPVVMVQGRHDQVPPGSAAQHYASALSAPSKQLVWFENSAHTPHLDEPTSSENSSQQSDPGTSKHLTPRRTPWPGFTEPVRADTTETPEERRQGWEKTAPSQRKTRRRLVVSIMRLQGAATGCGDGDQVRRNHGDGPATVCRVDRRCRAPRLAARPS